MPTNNIAVDDVIADGSDSSGIPVFCLAVFTKVDNAELRSSSALGGESAIYLHVGVCVDGQEGSDEDEDEEEDEAGENDKNKDEEEEDVLSICGPSNSSSTHASLICLILGDFFLQIFFSNLNTPHPHPVDPVSPTSSPTSSSSDNEISYNGASCTLIL